MDNQPARSSRVEPHPIHNPSAPSPELTLRALITGALLGVLLVPCNVYSGLKIGWSFNMSIAAALLAYAFWDRAEAWTGTTRWELLESNINQTTASSAASIVSSGLVAPIPALTLLTGIQLSWPALSAWVLSVSLLGVAVAVSVRRSMIEIAGLAFPAGVATAETVADIYGRGRDATRRVLALLASLVVAAAAKVYGTLIGGLPQLVAPLTLTGGGALAGRGVTLQNLGFVVDPSLLMLGFGAIIGPRTGLSLLLGAALAWGALAPLALVLGWATAGNPGEAWFGELVEWLLWPGVALMVSGALTELVLLWRSGPKRTGSGEHPAPARPTLRGMVPLALLAVPALLAQVLLFDIAWPVALLALPVAFGLGVVAARIVGETGIPPIGALGKVSQLTFGAAAPADLTANLMTANVTGGTAGQCADLLNDLKTGALLKATPYRQVAAQIVGVVTGSLAGSAAYLILVPDPAGMLLTAEWPAPAVATWQAVAQTLQEGLSAVPGHARLALLLGAGAGILLPLAQHRLRSNGRRVPLPSASALGLAFVVPAWISIGLCLGALLAAAARRLFPQVAPRYTLAVAAGLVAGESLAGVGGALVAMLSGA